MTMRIAWLCASIAFSIVSSVGAALALIDEPRWWMLAAFVGLALSFWAYTCASYEVKAKR